MLFFLLDLRKDNNDNVTSMMNSENQWECNDDVCVFVCFFRITALS